MHLCVRRFVLAASTCARLKSSVVNWNRLEGYRNLSFPMRHKLSIICALLLALCVSGWSGALAAALACPHARGEASRVMAKANHSSPEDHSCCRAKRAQAEPHCSTTERGAMSNMQMMPLARANFEAIDQPVESCTHCMDRSELPATPTAYQANRFKRSVDAGVSHTATPLASLTALFVKPVLYRQGSPPGDRVSKHLLISVFII